MSLIDEWTPLFPKEGEDPAPTRHAQKRIYQRLLELQPPPIGVHYYLGEGFRWIRIGFNGQAPLVPDDALKVADTIESSMGEQQSPLYFHALRPHDLLFFLAHGNADSEALPASFFGTPMQEIRTAWGAAKPAGKTSGPAPRQARTAASSSRSKAAAPYSQRARSKP